MINKILIDISLIAKIYYWYFIDQVFNLVTTWGTDYWLYIHRYIVINLYMYNPGICFNNYTLQCADYRALWLYWIRLKMVNMEYKNIYIYVYIVWAWVVRICYIAHRWHICIYMVVSISRVDRGKNVTCLWGKFPWQSRDLWSCSSAICDARILSAWSESERCSPVPSFSYSRFFTREFHARLYINRCLYYKNMKFYVWIYVYICIHRYVWRLVRATRVIYV